MSDELDDVVDRILDAVMYDGASDDGFPHIKNEIHSLRKAVWMECAEYVLGMGSGSVSPSWLAARITEHAITTYPKEPTDA